MQITRYAQKRWRSRKAIWNDIYRLVPLHRRPNMHKDKLTQLLVDAQERKRKRAKRGRDERPREYLGFKP